MDQPIAPQAARWDPVARHDMAMLRIERAIAQALGHPDVRFSDDDLAHVRVLMALPDHADDIPSAARGGETSSRPTVRSRIDPDKRYRLKGTGKIVTGAELLRRRGQA